MVVFVIWPLHVVFVSAHACSLSAHMITASSILLKIEAEKRGISTKTKDKAQSFLGLKESQDTTQKWENVRAG